jgi:MYXO-CTERM domain-containing protein
MTLAAAILASLLVPQNDKTQANGYDDAWEAAWKAHCRSVLAGGSGKTPGFVLHIGDSITYSSAYSSWALGGANRSTEDTAIVAWALGGSSPGGVDPTSKNGWYLAKVDSPSPFRSLTASGGMTTAEHLSGDLNGGPAMPAETVLATARTTLTNTTYTGNLHLTTLLTAFADAQFAVVMLGTNDIGVSRSTADFTNDLTTIVNQVEAKNIAVILSTIPPRTGSDVTAYNAAIRSFAQARGLPLIDYYQEILVRRPGMTWQGTLISGDGVHPTGPGNSDPYAGGDITAHRTGTNASNDGYMLRSWLTVQKLKEVKSYVIDDAPIPGGGGGGATIGSGNGDANDEDQKCSCGSAGMPGAWAAVLGLLLALPGLRRRR